MRRPWRGWIGSGAAFGVPLAAYLATLAPSITWRNGGADSGDTATAVAVLGIPHPPGYPLFVVAAHGLWRALPWLDPAAATGVLCALLGAGAALVAFGMAAEDGEDQVAALIAGLALALGPVWWQQSNLATPHALNLLLAALLSCLAWRGLGTGLGDRGCFLAGLAAGLGLSHHPTLLAAPLAYFVSGGRVRAPLAALGGFALGLGPWALLPLMAARQPPYVWGDPTTLGGFVDLVSGALYRDYALGLSPLVAAERLAGGVWVIARELGPVGVPSALVGGALLWDQRRGGVLFASSLSFLCLVTYGLYGARDVESYLLPACAAAAPLIAAGLRPVLGRAPLRGRGLAALAIAVGISFLLNWRAMDLSRDRAAIGYAEAVLSAAPPRALILAETDEHTFALWYAHVALGERPDVAVVGRWFVQLPWYRAYVARLHPELVLRADGVPVRQPSGRPVLLTDPEPELARRAVPTGPLYLVAPD